MMNTESLTLEELDKRITHYEDRLMDFIISEDQIEFIQEMLRELKSVKEMKVSHTFESTSHN